MSNYKVLAVFFSAVFVFAFFPANKSLADPVESGTCGTNITWVLDETGTLTITGTGAMTNYNMDDYGTPSPAPWLDYFSSIKSVVISEGITTVGNYAFYKCSKITSVSIPTTITSIGKYAFYNCEGITSISLPSNLKTIDYYAFAGCENLANCAIPSSVISLGDHAFYKCKSLTSMEIPQGIKTVSYYLFGNCTSLTSVKIPDSVTKIDNYAFFACGFTSIEIPESVVSLGFQSLSGSKLTSVTIPSKIKELDGYVFYGCRQLKVVNLPRGLMTIGSCVFADRVNVTDVYFAGTESDWKNVVVNSSNDGLKNATIHFALFTVNVSSDVTNGTIKASAKEAKVGDKIQFTAVPDVGYDLEAIKVNGVEINSSEFIMQEQDITVEATFIKHSLSKIEREEPTCTKDGHKEYYECSKCHKLFSDAEGIKEISKPEVIKMLGHDLKI